MARLPLVRIAILGLGTDWRERLSPAFEKMSSRLRVVAVYDDVAREARAAAARWRAVPVLGVRPLLMRRDVDAVLLRSVGWRQNWVLDQVQQRQLPILVGPEVALDDQQLETWRRHAEEDGTIVIPELRLRYQPATLRLRELQATVLGRVVKLHIRVPGWAPYLRDASALAQLLDWGCTLAGAPVLHIAQANGNSRSERSTRSISITLGYDRTTVDRPQVDLVLDWEDVDASGHSERQAAICEMKFERGSAEILTPHNLQWTAQSGPQQETLTADRSSTEVLLDLFARRVLGGLIPTPDLTDLRRASQLARTVEQLRHSVSSGEHRAPQSAPGRN